jgi:hypothetical protein
MTIVKIGNVDYDTGFGTGRHSGRRTGKRCEVSVSKTVVFETPLIEVFSRAVSQHDVRGSAATPARRGGGYLGVTVRTKTASLPRRLWDTGGIGTSPAHSPAAALVSRIGGPAVGS